MSDLINGREMLKRYQEDLCYGIACKECSMCTEDGGCRVEEWIDKYPSAETEIEIIRAEAYVKGIDSERKRISDWCRPQGEWIAVSSYDAFGGSEELWNAHGNPTAFHYCSKCKAQSYVNEFGEELLTDFCPNCGARMKGVDDE